MSAGRAPGQRRRDRGSPTELPVFTRYYDLFLWSFERSEGFPKVLRPSLTHRWQALLVDALEQLLELRYTRDRAALFRRTNLTFEKLRVLTRALEARRALSPSQYEHFQRRLDEVGRQLGGWQRAHAQRSGSGPGPGRGSAPGPAEGQDDEDQDPTREAERPRRPALADVSAARGPGAPPLDPPAPGPGPTAARASRELP